MTASNFAFAGFWRRLAASLIDVVLLFIVIFPILIAIYGMDYFDYEKVGFIAGPADFLISWVFPAALSIWLWMRYCATPGKLLLRAKVVDAKTGEALTLKQSVLRYFGYFVSLVPFGLGYLWVVIDPRKQALHDKIAGSIVVRTSTTSKAQ